MKSIDRLLIAVGVLAFVFIFQEASRVGIEREKTKQAVIKCGGTVNGL